MLNVLRPFPLGSNSLDLIADFHRDLPEWSNSVGDFNEISIIREIHWSDPDTEASSWGMGGYASENYVHGKKTPHMLSLHIYHRQLMAIITALLLWGVGVVLISVVIDSSHSVITCVFLML